MRKLIAGAACAALLLLVGCGGQPTDGYWLASFYNPANGKTDEVMYLDFQGNQGVAGVAFGPGSGSGIPYDHGGAQINQDGTLEYAFDDGTGSVCLDGCPFTVNGSTLVVQTSNGKITFQQSSQSAVEQAERQVTGS